MGSIEMNKIMYIKGNAEQIIRNINLDILTGAETDYTKLYNHILNIFKTVSVYDNNLYKYSNGYSFSDSCVVYGYYPKILFQYHKIDNKLYVSHLSFREHIIDKFFNNFETKLVDITSIGHIVNEIIATYFKSYFNVKCNNEKTLAINFQNVIKKY